MGQRTDVKSPVILLPFAICYESPWGPYDLAPIFTGGITVWPDVHADGWAHVRVAGRLGLRLPLVPVFFASLVTLFPSPVLLLYHLHPPLPRCIFTINMASYFSSCGTGSSNTEVKAAGTPLLRMSCPCCPWHLWVAGVLRREWTISWTAVGRGEWLSWSFHLAPRWKPFSHPELPTHSTASWGSLQVFCLAQPFPPADSISHFS